MIILKNLPEMFATLNRRKEPTYSWSTASHDERRNRDEKIIWKDGKQRMKLGRVQEVLNSPAELKWWKGKTCIAEQKNMKHHLEMLC